MNKTLGVIISVVLLTIVAAQIQYVYAANGNSQNGNLLTGPLTSPCKPGYGYGDKNHCHSGPPGLNK